MNAHVDISKPALAYTEEEFLALSVQDAADWVLKAVKEWAVAFGQKPTYELQCKLFAEEAGELAEVGLAFDPPNPPSVSQVDDFLKEASDTVFVLNGLAFVDHGSNEASNFIDLTGRIVPAMQLATAVINETIKDFVWNDTVVRKALRVAFYRTVQSNMTKLGDDGLPIYGEDGKVQKGPNYKAPELSDLSELILASVNTGNVIQ